MQYDQKLPLNATAFDFQYRRLRRFDHPYVVNDVLGQGRVQLGQDFGHGELQLALTFCRVRGRAWQLYPRQNECLFGTKM